jgi:hypothetical protein
LPGGPSAAATSASGATLQLSANPFFYAHAHAPGGDDKADTDADTADAAIAENLALEM